MNNIQYKHNNGCIAKLSHADRDGYSIYKVYESIMDIENEPMWTMIEKCLIDFGFEPVEQERETSDWINSSYKLYIEKLAAAGLSYFPPIAYTLFREAIMSFMPKSTIGDVYREKVKCDKCLGFRDVLPTGGASREVDYELIMEHIRRSVTEANRLGKSKQEIVKDGAFVISKYVRLGTKGVVLQREPIAQAEPANNASVVEAIISDYVAKHTYDDICEENLDRFDLRESIEKYLPHTTLSTPLKPLDVEEAREKIIKVLIGLGYDPTSSQSKFLREKMSSILSEYATPDRDAVIYECQKKLNNVKDFYNTDADEDFVARVAIGTCINHLEQLKSKPLSSDSQKAGI